MLLWLQDNVVQGVAGISELSENRWFAKISLENVKFAGELPSASDAPCINE